MAQKRQIVLDTETTGLNYNRGDRLIEIGGVELLDRQFTGNNFHYYINPGKDVEIDAGAIAVHGITKDFLTDKPYFATIYQEFFDYVNGAELIIHNAPFDMGFLNHEMKLYNSNLEPLEEFVKVFDTLTLARKKHPGKPNNLDALCKRYKVNNSKREFHGALLDAQLLAEVFLLMTQGQMSLLSEKSNDTKRKKSVAEKALKLNKGSPIIIANEEENNAHNLFLEKMMSNEKSRCIWKENVCED